MAEEPSQAIFSRLELADLVEEDGDSRKLLAEPGELMEPKRFCWSGPAAALSALFLVAVAGVAWYVALPSHSEVSPAMMQMKVAKHACMAQCPKPRRLKEKEEPDPAIALENCMEKCPSSGFMAAVEFEGCKAACESKHPQSGKMAKMPAGGPPMEACKQKCADGISGNFWRVRLQRCANQCAITTAAQEVMDQMKYNISSPELRDLETEVVSVLKKRITFKKRPDDHPFSFLIYQCKSKTEDALAKALGIPNGHAKPSVIMRPFSPGTRPVVSKVLAVDPGNDLEAAVDVEALSGETLDKLALPETLKSFDQALQDAVSEDPIMKDLLNLHPALAMEYSSASLAGDYVSMGWHTVCRRDKADTTLDGYGTSQIVNDQTLNSCSAMCNNWKSYCYGFEFRTREKRCEIWTAPICYHAEAAERRKHRAYPELLRGGPQRLLVLGAETGGRWSRDCFSLMRILLTARSRRTPSLVRRAMCSGWQRRWWALLACAVQRAVAMSATSAPWASTPPTPATPPCPLAILSLADFAGPSRLGFPA